MAKKTILKSCQILLNSVDFSDHVASVEISLKKEDKDTTNFGGGGKEHQAGLSDDTFVIEFQQDFNAAEINATLFPLYDQELEFTVEVKPTNAAVSATNPSFTGTCVLLEYQPLSGKVGDVSMAKVTFLSQRTGIVMAITGT